MLLVARFSAPVVAYGAPRLRVAVGEAGSAAGPELAGAAEGGTVATDWLAALRAAGEFDVRYVQRATDLLFLYNVSHGDYTAQKRGLDGDIDGLRHASAYVCAGGAARGGGVGVWDTCAA